MAELNPQKAVEDVVNGLGGLAEMAGVYRDFLLSNGFTREESVYMASELVLALVTAGKK